MPLQRAVRRDAGRGGLVESCGVCVEVCSWISGISHLFPTLGFLGEGCIGFPKSATRVMENTGEGTLDPGSWILDLQPIAPKKASIAKIQNPGSGADLHTGRQNCASSLRKRSLDEGLMSFLEIQCMPSGGPEPPQDHRSRLTGSKGAFRCWQGQDHEARSKTPVTTIQEHKPLLEIPMGPA